MREQNFQKISWFWDRYTRKLLNLDPPYQRRSVWNQKYKDDFIDTILLNYPAPAIFLYEETSPEGATTHAVVDGKQRLTAVFEFVEGAFPIAQTAEKVALRGRYFQDLSSEDKVAFWNYRFSIEYIPSTDENLINSIFDRINRNTAKLSHQELRHARLDGEFIRVAEELTDFWLGLLPPNFPRIAAHSKRQMKDVELTAEILLYLENGPKNLSQAELDQAFSDRDGSWERRHEIEPRFRAAVTAIADIVTKERWAPLAKSRLRNQADFFSLVGVFDLLLREGTLPPPDRIAINLTDFVGQLEAEDRRARNLAAQEYYEATRSASNDSGPRTKREEILRRVILELAHEAVG